MANTQSETHSSKRGQPVLIRCATLDDAEPLLEFTRHIMSEPNATLTEWDEIDGTSEAERQYIAHALAGARDLMLVAEVDGELVGMLNFSTHPKCKLAHAGEFGMSVHRSFRDQGIGRMLLHSLLAWASNQKSIEQVELSVFAGNARAVHLYRSLVFAEEGRSRNAIKFADGTYDDLILMKRYLTNVSS